MSLHKLRLAAVPITFSSRLFFLKPFPNTLTLGLFSRHLQPHKPLLVRAFSASAAVEDIPATQASDSSARPQWKAAIDFKWIRDNKEAVEINIKNRNSNANLEAVLELYENMVNLQKEVEQLREERNNVAKKMKGKLEPSQRETLVEEGKNLKESLVTLEEDLVKLKDELQHVAQSIPNMTHPDVPVGGEDSSAIRKEVGSPREFSFPIKDHLQLGKDLDLIDFDSAAEGFTPLTTPEIVRSAIVEKCGFQPRGDNTQVYSIDGTDQCLIGTAEIPVGGIHMDSILLESVLPLKYIAFSHCFRTEAGAAGAATKGLYRVHQFNKAEMFVICRPEDSESFHQELIQIEEDLFTSLGLHFKTLDMATADLGAPAYRKFDVEAWMPGLGRFGEISSASNCTDYQSRRLGIRYRPSEPPQTGPKKGKANLPATKFVHTLNATACAIPRMMVCLLENYQQEDGAVVIPEPLRPFMGGIELIKPKLK
ncbi:serine--tRNA ligase, chloroplastic/mitochondrial isoform X2 [Arabidopsis lyrata subsp. lyrata]|uniref:serine--tRNA ligase, chloroplastic/mitochondrial isoform X2 n=1 Tax=Arabidopsis lyrata subsp. lyrata TaxID=81972 RepID=UPI000A29B977|nr:serine--tRNA ligase, chloroplastic/mitochondrial isoform X2 [Arabidopsis lyrata subsp. lyrata]|eukprot:XP_020866969.1 serine--tRNA ligase, chloroplastic/mitochondrial isoform X2 [Arabidopsis lyrata subsp. lyrata]